MSGISPFPDPRWLTRIPRGLFDLRRYDRTMQMYRSECPYPELVRAAVTRLSHLRRYEKSLLN